MHIGKAFLLPIYSILNGIFCYYVTILRSIYVHTLERWLHAIHSHIFTFIWKAIPLSHIHAYIHSLERQFLCYTFIGKAIFVLPIHIFERQFHVICSYFEKHFRAIFNIYAHLQSTWLPIQHMYALFERDFPLATHSIYPCTWWRTPSHHLSTKKSSWCNPKQALV